VLGASLPARFPFVDNPIVGATFWIGRLTAIKVIARYLWLAIWPANLSCDYSYPQIPLVNGSLDDWLSCIAVAAAVVGVLFLYRRNRTVFFLACFALVNLVPVSNLFFPIGSIMAERFLYLPLAGLLACLVMGIYAVAERTRVALLAPSLLCIIALGFCLRTWTRNLDWQNDLAMATSAVRTSPNSFKTHKLLAAVLYESDPNHSNIDRITSEADKSMALLDSLPDALNEAEAYLWPGAYHLVKGDRLRQPGSDGQILSSPASVAQYHRAREILLRSIAIDRSARAEYHRQLERSRGNSAASFTRNGDMETFRGPSEAQRLLSEVYLRLGDPDDALDAATHSSQLDPLNPEAYRQIAEVFLAGRRADDAAAKLMAGLLITSDPGLREELLNLYRSDLDVQGCAVVPGPRGPAINPHCEMVQRHICAASVETIKALLQTGRRDLAETQKSAFLRDYGCAAGPIENALRDESFMIPPE
jgi:protein O-mannosyl-transferase